MTFTPREKKTLGRFWAAHEDAQGERARLKQESDGGNYYDGYANAILDTVQTMLVPMHPLYQYLSGIDGFNDLAG